MNFKTDVTERLRQLQLPFRYVEHQAVHGMEECLQLDFVNETICFCKNIFLCNRQQTRFYLYLCTPKTVFHTAQFSRKVSSSRLSFAPREQLEKIMSVTSGALSPFSLWYLHSAEVFFVIDNSILEYPFLAFHPCDNTATVIIDTDAFIKNVLPTMDCEKIFID